MQIAHFAMLRWNELKREVERKVGSTTLSAISTFVVDAKPSLWGEKQPPHFVRKYVAVALFKDLSGKSYDTIEREVHPGFALPHTTLQHNVQVLRLVMRRWAKENMVLGSLDDWRDAVKDVKFDRKKFPKLCAWADSVNFRLQRSAGRGPSSDYWSGTSEGPARRFMILRDGDGRIIKAFGGYSPKTFDAHFMEIQHDWLEENMRGAGIVADQHFRPADATFDTIEWYTPIRKPRPPRKRKREDQPGQWQAPGVLTKKQEKWNEAVHPVRARIEKPFGDIKTRWKGLSHPWGEDPEQLDCLIWTAIGVYNAQK